MYSAIVRVSCRCAFGGNSRFRFPVYLGTEPIYYVEGRRPFEDPVGCQTGDKALLAVKVLHVRPTGVMNLRHCLEQKGKTRKKRLVKPAYMAPGDARRVNLMLGK